MKGRQADSQTARPAERLHRQTHKTNGQQDTGYTDSLKSRQTDGEIDQQKGWTDRQTDRQPGRRGTQPDSPNSQTSRNVTQTDSPTVPQRPAHGSAQLSGPGPYCCQPLMMERRIPPQPQAHNPQYCAPYRG